MKIGQKITLGFFGIAALLALAGSTYIIHLKQMQNELDTIIALQLDELEAAENIFKLVQSAHNGLVSMLANQHGWPAHTDPRIETSINKDLSEAAQSLQDLERSTRAQQQAHTDAAGEQEELERIRLLKQQLDHFSQQVRRALQLLNQGEHDKTLTLTEEQITPLAFEVQSSVSLLEIDAQMEISEALNRTRMDTERGIVFHSGATLAAIITAMLLGLFISRGIARNVLKLHAATRRLGRGKLNTRITVTGNDEIGLIAKDINRMAEDLRGAIISRDDLAKEIENRKKVEASLHLERNQAQIYLDIVEVMLVVLDAHGIIQMINRKGCQMLGYQLPDIIGKNWFKQCIPADAQEEVREVFRQLMSGEMEGTEYYENPVLKRSGETIIVAFHNAYIRNEHGNITGILFSGEDITQRIRSGQALRDQQAHITLLLNSTAEAIYGLDTDGKCTFVNKSFLELLGYSGSDELLGRSLHEIMHHTRSDGTPYPKQECRVMDAIRNGVVVHVDDEHFWRQDGSSFPVSYWAHPIRQNNHVTGCVVTFLDISEQIKSKHALAESADRLRQSLEGTIQAIAKSVEARDPYTAGHQHRVSKLATAIAGELGLDNDTIEGIRMGAAIHDIGKIHLPAELLSKPSKLTDVEYMLIKSHPSVGYEILKEIEFPWPIADIAYQHHEHVDGSGYPQGLTLNDICMEARIVAVADAMEAISSHRPYRPALSTEFALEEIQKQSGKFYDPQVVDACVRLFTENRFSFD